MCPSLLLLGASMVSWREYCLCAMCLMLGGGSQSRKDWYNSDPVFELPSIFEVVVAFVED